MLHCPMRMHEKVINLLYNDILNGKTKHEVNRACNSKVYLPPLGVVAVGERFAKEFTNEKGEYKYTLEPSRHTLMKMELGCIL
jgi:hypothetical protein